MSIEDPMTIDERRKYLHQMQKRYLSADRTQRGQLLDEMEKVTLFVLPNAQPGSIQDMFLTLFDPPEFMKGADIPVTFSDE